MNTTVHETGRRVDADFAEDILAELYAYGRKRRWVAYLLWGTLGWFGAHRFYLDRPLTGLLQLFTLGGVFFWWFADLFLIPQMVREQHAEQERRSRHALPPLELAFMPPLWKNALEQPPEWTTRWREAGPARRAVRLLADTAVLLLVGFLLGVAARALDVPEAPIAVLILAGLTAAGSASGGIAHLPVLHGLIRWSHRLRLFYYYSRPGGALALLFRPVTGLLLAPFRRRDRAEVRLYLQLGAVFTLIFLLVDFGADVIGPVARGRVPSLTTLLGIWIQEAVTTFIVIFAFATPVGAILTKYLLTLRTHTVPRLLSLLVVVAVLLGLLA